MIYPFFLAGIYQFQVVNTVAVYDEKHVWWGFAVHPLESQFGWINGKGDRLHQMTIQTSATSSRNYAQPCT